MANDQIGAIAADGDALVISLNRTGQAQNDIKLTLGEASLLAATLPGLLAIARTQGHLNGVATPAHPLRDYHVDLAPGLYRILLGLVPTNGQEQVFAINAEMVPALLQDLRNALLLLNISTPGLPN